MRKVIIVDDEPLVQVSIRKRVRWDMLDLVIVGFAANGIEALALIEDKQPDIVLADIRMPLMDGLALITEAKQRGHEAIQFVIVSGYSDFTYARQAIRLGVRDFIQKPIDELELEQTLSSICAQMDRGARQNSPAEREPQREQATLTPSCQEETVERIRRYIDQHYDQPLSLSRIAQQFHLNDSYVSKLFRQRQGKRLMEYIEDVRVEKARLLFETSDIPVVDVAARVGYYDANYFSRIFKKNTGLTPSCYQRGIRGGRQVQQGKVEPG